MLGLTATNIRYLDHKRDMTTELFDGVIASEISLTEAMARGILPLPKYVISVYSYQKNRSLQRADGMGAIFTKHIKNPGGKYIVFCANSDHLYEMISMVPEWFENIDLFLHIYYVFVNNLESEEVFIDFVTDRSSHLKLLFAIDMINEGIHIDDVDGVILLRPTISPIVFKQQIGRALAVGKKRMPIIFDLVNNSNSLSYIEDLKDEFEEMVHVFEQSGENKGDSIEKFEIVDELRESRILFEQLQRNLDST